MRMPVTVYGVATALARAPQQVEAMKDAGWEIASHGLKWIEYKDCAPQDEARDIQKAKALHEAVTGDAPRGWYTGRCSQNTVELIAKDGSFDYVSDAYADDLPYWVRHGDTDQLVIPYTLDANDMRFATPQGFNSGTQFFDYLKDSFDALYAEGLDGAPKMMSIGLHCRLIGRPGRIMALQRFLEYIQAREGVWVARRIDIAEHWAKHHPPTGPKLQPSSMDQSTFMDSFGGIFENSPWVAEDTFKGELGPANDSALGLHAAMCQAFRQGSNTARLAVLNAHPDLAGKLAQAKRLTAESTSEQAAAGLDALTDAERAEFETLNSQYTKRFGFPFIIAVRDHDKSGILRAFQSRLSNAKDVEFKTACTQVERIARLRLEDLF
jgi:urate oxidase